jgi:hypothetical protein
MEPSRAPRSGSSLPGAPGLVDMLLKSIPCIGESSRLDKGWNCVTVVHPRHDAKRALSERDNIGIGQHHLRPVCAIPAAILSQFGQQGVDVHSW